MTPSRLTALFFICVPASAATTGRVELEIPSLQSSGAPAPVVGAGAARTFAPPSLAPGAVPLAPALTAPGAPAPSALVPTAAEDSRPAALETEADAGAAWSAERTRFDGGEARTGAPAVSAPRAPRGDADQLRGGVFIQQEFEGSLLHEEQDAKGDFFRWYRPVELRPELVARVEAGMGRVAKTAYRAKRLLTRAGREPAYGAWNAFSRRSKLLYLDMLEQAVRAEKGEAALWNGRESLLLERAPSAPPFLTKNPHMEDPPQSLRGTTGATFLKPELVTAKDKPVRTVADAIGRARFVIEETGHAGVQFHVFMKVPPERLRAQRKAIQGALRLLNDVAFARSAVDSSTNLDLPNLQPWTSPAAARVEAMIRNPTRLPSEPGDEKYAFVGFREWGMEDGLMVVSLELRGASVPLVRPRGSGSRVMGADAPIEAAKRDFTGASDRLRALATIAEAIAEGRLPDMSESGAPGPDIDAADAALRAALREAGADEHDATSYSRLAAYLSGQSPAYPSYLLPFAADADSPAAKALARRVVSSARRLRTLELAGGPALEDHRRFLRYEFWTAYADWARDYGRRRGARLDALVDASR